jgi:N-acetylglucosaminyldiphosphoundecaprenol N-acetyl-beta-D-mannosaminyltransferase
VNLPVRTVLSTRVHPIGAEAAGKAVVDWAKAGGGRVVCAANVHMVMEAWDDETFAAVLAGADLVVCDGRPVMWACALQGDRDARHTRGLDLALAVCANAARDGLTVGLYGGRPEVTAEVRRRLEERFAGLRVTYAWSPPFRALDEGEDAEAMAAIEEAGVGVLFVGLGCPKQERWMAEHRDRVTFVMIGVGAAFDMIAGTVPVAPGWMQRGGLEWVHRLFTEPRRLWRRYAKHNARFVGLVLWRALRAR